MPWASLWVCTTDKQVKLERILCALNVSVVGLMAVPSGNLPGRLVQSGEDATTKGSDVNEKLPQALRVLSYSRVEGAECLGLGIFRRIDVKERVLYVLTPVPL